jgi:hypothetical protein
MTFTSNDIQLARRFHGLIGGAYAADAETFLTNLSLPDGESEATRVRQAAVRAQFDLIRRLDEQGLLKAPRDAQEEENLPCPVCGGLNLFEYSESNDRDDHEHTVECMTCHTRGPIAAWNGEDRALDAMMSEKAA